MKLTKAKRKESALKGWKTRKKKQKKENPQEYFKITFLVKVEDVPTTKDWYGSQSSSKWLHDYLGQLGIKHFKSDLITIEKSKDFEEIWHSGFSYGETKGHILPSPIKFKIGKKQK